MKKYFGKQDGRIFPAVSDVFILFKSLHKQKRIDIIETVVEYVK